MRRILLIGIGAGNPELLTLAAITALNTADVVLSFDKGEAKDELTAIRKAICAHHRRRPLPFVEIEDPQRDASDGYHAGVDAWHDARARLVRTAIADNVGEKGTAAFLVWGDPALYDSTLRVVERALDGASFAAEIDIIPGISSIQLLAARHKIALNRIGAPVHVTTGRRLAQDGLPNGDTNVVVMLDGGLACRAFVGKQLHIYWGGCLGTGDEVLVAGPLDDVIDEMTRRRSELKARKGWVMDTYLLRRNPKGA